jgi:hypothetical protein
MRFESEAESYNFDTFNAAEFKDSAEHLGGFMNTYEYKPMLAPLGAIYMCDFLKKCDLISGKQNLTFYQKICPKTLIFAAKILFLNFITKLYKKAVSLYGNFIMINFMIWQKIYFTLRSKWLYKKTAGRLHTTRFRLPQNPII